MLRWSVPGPCPRCAARTCRRACARRPRKTAQCARHLRADNRWDWERNGCGSWERLRKACILLEYGRFRIDPKHAFVIKSALGRAVNSAVECHLHTVEVTGSIPVSPTSQTFKAVRQKPELRAAARVSGFFHIRAAVSAGPLMLLCAEANGAGLVFGVNVGLAYDRRMSESRRFAHRLI